MVTRRVRRNALGPVLHDEDLPPRRCDLEAEAGKVGVPQVNVPGGGLGRIDQALSQAGHLAYCGRLVSHE
jgi:hypothetical protein